MKYSDTSMQYHGVCASCLGTGKKSIGHKKKKVHKPGQSQPVQDVGQAILHPCKKCCGTGLIIQHHAALSNPEHHPRIAIVGGGIAGVALALACQQRCIPFMLFERDASFLDRAQGYGLTLQQANRVIEDFGLSIQNSGVVSTRHTVHNSLGEVLGEWGDRKYGNKDKDKAKKTNIHISRQALRHAFIEQLEVTHDIKWGHKLVNFCYAKDTYSLDFQVGDITKSYTADIVVGADGIRSKVRELLFGESDSELQYLDTLVILGICPLHALEDLHSDLLDNKSVFQSADGHQRIYVMPYDKEAIMWQYSIPMEHKRALELSGSGAFALHKFAQDQLQWHAPIPQIIKRTPVAMVSGYPVYDRPLLQGQAFVDAHQVTLIGDAAHPMSPFKGQGANQALLDALALARTLYKGTGMYNLWRNQGVLPQLLRDFEHDMLRRSTTKVLGSKQAVSNLHCPGVLRVDDHTRGGK